jgi:hypothetical protein
MPDSEFTMLVQDMKLHGQRLPITLYEGQVLEGWHRYRACGALGIEAETKTFTGTLEEAVAFVVSLNVRRRHLDTGQLALFTVEHLLPRIAAEARTRQRAGKKVASDDLSATRRTGRRQKQPAAVDAAKAVGVSARSVERAQHVLMHGTEEEVAAVRRGSRKLAAVAAAVQQRTRRTKARATKPSARKATPRPTATTTTALVLIPEPAALMLPDAEMIAALKALNESLREHVAGWLGDPEFLIGTLRTWELMAREHLDPQGSCEWRYTPSYDVKTLTVELPSERPG